MNPQTQAQRQVYYEYDESGQLLSLTDGDSHIRFGYDRLGRITTQQSHDDRLSYHYDKLKRHDRISGEVQSYVYDLHDRLICARISRRNKETEEWHYRYDVLGRRIEKVRSKNGEFLSETKTQFIWDGSHLVQEINHKTDRTFSYIYSHPNSYEPLAQICTEYKGEGTQSETNAQHIHYFHCDQIGVPREMTDEAGNLLWYADYKGWGGIREAHNLKDAHQPFRLQNQYVDEETGLHYNLFRYYDPHIGRFTQQDPIGLAGGMNLYRFEGTVQNQVDPLGLFAPVLAAPWILEALAYATTAMTGILVGVGIMDAMEESEDSSDSSSTPITIGAEETNDIGKCPNKPKCPPDVYEKLNSAVEKAKDYTSSLGGCKGWMAEPALYVRRDAAYKELKARKLREDTCWNGGDSGHKERMQNLQNQIKNCEKFIGKGFR